jgi:hypothetical protein
VAGDIGSQRRKGRKSLPGCAPMRGRFPKAPAGGRPGLPMGLGKGVAVSDQRTSRWMGPLGLAILVLVFVGFGALAGNSPGENASGAKVVSYWNTHQGVGWLQMYLVGVALALVVVYGAQLRTVLRDAEGRPSFLPSTAFAGAIVFAAATVFSGCIHMTILIAAHNHQPSIAQTLNFIDANDYLTLLFGLAMMTVATGACILNRSSLPKWLGWVSVVIGVLCVAGPLSFIGLIGGGIWLAVAGFVVGYHQPGAARAVPSAMPQAVGTA